MARRREKGSRVNAGFRRASLMVLTGSVIGFGINLALTPVISRLFTPETFGFFATLTAVTSAFVGVSTFRLEVLAQRKENERESRDLLRLAVLTSCSWGLTATLVALGAVIGFGVSGWWVVVGPLLTLASLQLIGTAVLTRARNYRVLAVSNLVQGASAGVVQIILGWAGAGVGALLAGFGAARLIWLGVLRRERPSVEGLRHVWVSSRRFALVSGGSAFINSCAGQLPILLCFYLFGQGSVGLLAMAIRILVAPLGVVGQAAASANIGEVGQLLRERNPIALRIVWMGARDLFLIGLVPCGLAAAFGYSLVPLILGSQWAQSGAVISGLAVGTLAQFTVAPFSQLLNLTGRGRWMLIWDAARFLVTTASFGFTALLGGPLLIAVCVYSISLVGMYIALARMIRAAVRTAAT